MKLIASVDDGVALSSDERIVRDGRILAPDAAAKEQQEVVALPEVDSRQFVQNTEQRLRTEIGLQHTGSLAGALLVGCVEFWADRLDDNVISFATMNVRNAPTSIVTIWYAQRCCEFLMRSASCQVTLYAPIACAAPSFSRTDITPRSPGARCDVWDNQSTGCARSGAMEVRSVALKRTYLDMLAQYPIIVLLDHLAR